VTRAVPTVPGTREERAVERRDRTAALVLAVALHALLLALGNRSTDAQLAVSAPGAGPGGAMPVVALSSDAAERLLARLGPPSALLEIGSRGAAASTGPDAPDRAFAPLPAGGLGPAFGPRVIAPEPSPDTPRSPIPVAPAAPRERPALSNATAEPNAETRVPLPAPPTPPTPRTQSPSVGPDVAGAAPPAGTAGEAARGASATGGDDAPFLDVGVLDALVRHRVVPEYPPAARHSGHEGAVVVVLQVDGAGAVSSARVQTSSGYRDLDHAALRAVRKWRFDPDAVRERGTGNRFRLTLRFSLRP